MLNFPRARQVEECHIFLFLIVGQYVVGFRAGEEENYLSGAQVILSSQVSQSWKNTWHFRRLSMETVWERAHQVFFWKIHNTAKDATSSRTNIKSIIIMTLIIFLDLYFLKEKAPPGQHLLSLSSKICRLSTKICKILQKCRDLVWWTTALSYL